MAAADCRTLKTDTGRMLKEMNRLHISLIDSNKYACVHDESVRQRKLLKAMGLPVESLDIVACDINKRNSETVVSQIHTMPEIPDPGKRRPTGREAKKIKEIAEGKRPPVEEQKPKGKRGRPKGTKKEDGRTDTGKKTDKKPKAAKTRRKKSETDSLPKRKPGRPKGSKNKKTLAREEEQSKRERRKKRISSPSAHPD